MPHPETRFFPITEVMTVASGYYLRAPMSDAHRELEEFLAGRPLDHADRLHYSADFERWVREQYPAFGSITEDDLPPHDLVDHWLEPWIARFSDFVPVIALPSSHAARTVYVISELMVVSGGGATLLGSAIETPRCSRFYLEGDYGPLCDKGCRSRSLSVYRFRPIRLLLTDIEVPSLLVGVCERCGKITSIPHQSIEALRQACGVLV